MNYIHIDLVLYCGLFVCIMAMLNTLKQDINYIYYMKGLNKTGIYITHSYMLFRHYSGKNYTNT